MTFEEFKKKKNEGSLINRNTQSLSNTKMSFEEFKAKKQNGTLMKTNNVTSAVDNKTPRETITEKVDKLWVENEKPNVLAKQDLNSVKPVNIADFVKQVENSEAGKRASLSIEADKLSKQIQQKEQEYNKANNISDWNKKNQAKTEIGQELNGLKEKLNATKTTLAELNRPNDKLLTAEEIAEYNKNAPLSQKIDKAIKYDIPKTAEKIGRTVLDLGANVAVGATNAVEGMTDAVVGNLGALASGVTSGFGLAPNELSEKIKKGAEEFTKFNFSGEDILEEKKNEGTGIYEPKILNWKVRDALNVISGMMTSAAIGGMPAFVASAAGQNIEEALLDNQSLNRAVIYGDTAGVVEGLTEKMFDAVKLLGGGKFDKFLPKGAISKLVGGSAGEAIEEVIADGINPVLKYFTYEKGTYDMPSLVEYLNILKEAAFNGFTLGFIMKGGQDISTPQIREQYKEEIYTAVDKSKLPENIKETVKEVMITPAQAQINQDLQNLRNQNPQNVNSTIQRENVTGLPKMNAQNQAQNSSIEQSNVTLPTRTETAQNSNMEQITQTPNLPTQKAQETLRSAKNDKFHKGLEKFNSKKFDDNDNIVVLEETPLYLYNLGYDSDKPIVLNMPKLETIMKEPKGTFEGKNQHGITMDVIEQLPNAIQNPLNVIRNPKFRDRFVVITELTDQYGDIVIVPIEMNTNGYIENIETDVNRIASVYGKENYDLAKRDGLNSYIENNKNNIVYDIDNDVTKNKSRVIDPRLQLSSTNNTASNNSINPNDSSVNTEYAQNNKNDTTYISPVSDIQSATKFVENATVNDIETLQKMVDEAEKNPDRIDLQFFAEKARAKLEKLSREQVESMLEEGINQNKISYGDSIYRNLRRALGEKGYKYVKENILDKLDSAKLDNVNMKTEIANELKSYVVDGLGIKKGSKESELVQKYGEKEITLDELKEATPNWENVVKADDWFRSKYDELIDRINESRAEIYPYIEEKIEATELELKVVKQQIKDIEENGTPNFKKDAEIRTQIENIQNRIDSKTKALEEAKNKNTLKYKNNLRIKNEAEQRLGDLNDLLEIRTENKLYKLTEKAEKLQNILDSEELWRGKRIPKRKDYYRHFQEMTEGFEALGNILSTPSEISNNLSGISENTKPSSKWLGLAQRRLTNKTKYDAVGGFLNYLDSASYAINIDPEIKRIRDFTEEIRNATQDNTANRLIEYLTDYANDLAGKTNPMDRYIQKVIPGGRKTMKAISWVTNRIKSNAVLGNFNSAAAQILNIPQGLADIKNPKNIAIGFWETLAGDKDGKYKNSQFITERFNSDVYSQFNERLIDQPKKFATWLLGALDEFGTKTIWNGEYSKAVDIGIKDPTRYADYRTRDLVAGRGIGELSLNQRSKTIGLLAPFTVEVSNYWGVVKDFISAKDFGGLVLLQVFAFLFNKGLEELGLSAGVFDLIDALIDAWNTEGGIDKKAGRVAGEFLSNTMFGQQIAGVYPENGADLGFYQLPTRSELFGDADPTRMGTGSVLSKAISNPVTSVVLPWGGTQLNKTTQGLSTFAKGGAYSKDSEGKEKLKYPVEQNLENFAKSALFGKWSTEGAKRYIDSGFKALSANQTEGYKKAKKAGITDEQFYNAYNAQKKVEGLGDLTSLVKKNEIDKATKGLSQSKRKILYETFNIAKGEWDNSKIVYPYEIKAQKEKIAREKLKTKKK